uniref:Beta-defensin I-3 n=1 Tax=Paralichthys olivaceus TaxID=8255 RepID=D2WPD0_PAROL|nr:beta-defensin I-3 [Paralichthys olivaceus]ADA84143.1 beta-defensin I-3 [Paralichthys olivaceus]
MSRYRVAVLALVVVLLVFVAENEADQPKPDRPKLDCSTIQGVCKDSCLSTEFSIGALGCSAESSTVCCITKP